MADDLVIVATFRYLPEAEAARMHLESEGIQAFLADAEIVTMDWLIANAVGDIKLQVAGRDVEQVKRILNRVQARRRYRETGAEDVNECLACGAHIPEDKTRCPSCGW